MGSHDCCKGTRATLRRAFFIRNQYLRQLLGEMLGTFVLMTLGNGAVAQRVLSKDTQGSMLSVNFAYGIGVTMGVLVCGGISGGHLNPAISFTMALLGRLQWKKLPTYFIGQYLGSFVSSAVVYGIYYDLLNEYDGGVRQVDGEKATAAIFSTYPHPAVSTLVCFFDQITGTAILAVGVLAISDSKNMSVPKPTVAALVGALVVAIGASIGVNCGYAINPARDLSPRLFSALAGWGIKTISFRNFNYFWVPVVGPHLGAVVGALIYQFCVGLHWPREEEEQDDIKDAESNQQALEQSL